MRVVIKIGTQIIADENGLSQKKIGALVSEIARGMRAGHQIVLVSSGAIGAGRPLLKFADPLEGKIAAAIGQPRLMHDYIVEARKHKLIVGQVLILDEDLTNKAHFRSLMRSMEAMIAHGILPIINENDVMKKGDLSVGDNDMFSAHMAVGLQADKLLILTNQDGLYNCNPMTNTCAELLTRVTNVNAKIESFCSPEKSTLGRGGMLTKVRAAKYAMKRGVETLIGNGEKKDVITSVLNKTFPGTRFIAKKNKAKSKIKKNAKK